MKNLLSNPITDILSSLILYILLGLIFGISFIPAGLLFHLFKSDFTSLTAVIYNILLLGICAYLFIVSGLLTFGFFEKIFSLGLKPGKYDVGSFAFYHWLIMGSIHTVNINLFLPMTIGSAATKLYYKIIGIKIGKNVFINTVGLHDGYLLEIGDNVVIGGRTEITCHIFEKGTLILDKVHVGNNVLIGANCYIMPGASISDNCDISANSVIKKGKKIEEKSVIMPIPSLSIKEVAFFSSLIKKKNN